MSDVTLTAAGLLEKLCAECDKLLDRYSANGGPGGYSEGAASPDYLDRAQATTELFLRFAENATDRGRLGLVQEAIARITADPTQFDTCQNPRCQGGGKIEHARLAILLWAKFCCACAAARERR